MSEKLSSFSEFVTALRMLHDYKSKSLPQFTKPFLIESPLFIQNKVFLETDILNSIIGAIYDIYTGFILVAVKLNDIVRGGRRVRDVIATVSSNMLVADHPLLASENLGYYSMDDMINLFTNPSLAKKAPIVIATESKDNEEKQKGDGGKGASILETKQKPLITGRIIQVTVGVPDGGTMNIPLFLKLNPRVIPDEIVEAVISYNITPDIVKRWLMFRAGEISFIKDFILQLDILSNQRKALAKDRSNVLYETMVKRRKSFFRRLLKLSFLNYPSQNIANSIFIFDQTDLETAAHKVGIDFNRYAARKKFFDRAMAMMVVGVDNNFNHVNFYIDCIDSKSTFSFMQILKGEKKNEIDLVTIMQMLAQGAAPNAL